MWQDLSPDPPYRSTINAEFELIPAPGELPSPVSEAKFSEGFWQRSRKPFLLIPQRTDGSKGN